MKTVLLHIGTSKTGTKSIQEALARARESGTIRPVCYPMPRGDRNNSALATLYLPYERMPRFVRSTYLARSAELEKMRHRYRRALFDELRTERNAAISSENLSVLSPSEVRQLRGDLEDAGFGRFIIVLYVRDPAHYYLSQMQQDLKASSRIADPETFRYPFREIAETWEGIFPGDLNVRHFRDDPEFDVVGDFSRFLRRCLGVNLPPLATRLNATISAEGMQILQHYRLAFWPDSDDIFTPDTNRLVDLLKQLSSGDIRQTTPALTADVSVRIRAAHRADAEFIRDRYGVDLGLPGVGVASAVRVDRTHLIEDVLQGVDPEVVTQLLLRTVKQGLNHPPRRASLPRRVASRISREFRLRRPR